MKENKLAMLDKILESLAQPHNQYVDNFGLYNGKMGICVAFFLTYKITGNLVYRKQALSLVDEISENIDKIKELGLGAGLAGIGWGIEWIIQNKFVDEDSNEILSDLDDELYRDVIFSKSKNLSLYNGALGKAVYFYKRLNSRYLQNYRFRKISIIECIVLLTDEINENLDLIVDSCKSEHNVDMIELIQIYFFTKRVLPCKINTEKVKKMGSRVESIINYILSNAYPDRGYIEKTFIESYKKSNQSFDTSMRSFSNSAIFPPKLNSQTLETINNSHLAMIRHLDKNFEMKLGLDWEEIWLIN
jgi:hypothetical protein